MKIVSVYQENMFDLIVALNVKVQILLQETGKSFSGTIYTGS